MMVNADLIGQPGGARLLTTPALIVDGELLEHNTRAMVELAAKAGMKLRPHAKTHKCSELGKRQIEWGANGLCCATPHEVLTMLGAGIGDLLLTAPVTQPRQAGAIAAAVQRMRQSGQNCEFSVVVDSSRGIELWEEALRSAHLQINALVDLDIGMQRTGAPDGPAAIQLATRLSASPNLKYAGVQAYSGLVQHIESFEERQQVYGAHLQKLAAMLDELRAAGFAPAIVSGGGTGSFPIDAASGLFNEHQAGSFVFMDVEYGRVAWGASKVPFDVAIWLRGHVISQNHTGMATVNLGTKSLSSDSFAPGVRGQPDWTFQFFGDEYGKLRFGGPGEPLWGKTVDFVLPHCDPTVNLHNEYHVLLGDTLAAIWPIDGRGVL
ncbi:MAG: DSD1 family PLP-dependent enzyme [Ottowia sp.]|uniref:DSD1 family PLP-dependent enzyme n=1 Tax=Ottowia sp. TaxID=1898956 RepID=UPI003C776252